MSSGNSAALPKGLSGSAALFRDNRLLASLSPADRHLIEPALEEIAITRGEVIFDAGDDVIHTYFPGAGAMISLVLVLRDGRTVEAATVGREGAIGGIVSAGHKPAFARSMVQVGGRAVRIMTAQLEEAKHQSPTIRELFSRYADALLAQVLQSVACNTFHSLEARCCRWLLTSHDRVGDDVIPLTQEYLADMLGVQRSTVSEVAGGLQERGLISYRRGRIRILDRAALERSACECYGDVERHFRLVLPEVKPQIVSDRDATRG
jgi:CRP-like cAMP-binding protein